MKHSGALISSRLIPPKVGSRDAIIFASFIGSFSLISRSNALTSAKRLNKTLLPSMTGLPAKAPIFPKPKTAVPLDITPTKLPLEVYWYARAGFFSISKQGKATPGVYARDNSLAVPQGLVGFMEIFPGLGFCCYCKVFSFKSDIIKSYLLRYIKLIKLRVLKI